MQKLSPDMPLQLASETLLRMFRARVHHHRQGQVLSGFSFLGGHDTTKNCSGCYLE